MALQEGFLFDLVGYRWVVRKVRVRDVCCLVFGEGAKEAIVVGCKRAFEDEKIPDIKHLSWKGRLFYKTSKGN